MSNDTNVEADTTGYTPVTEAGKEFGQLGSKKERIKYLATAFYHPMNRKQRRTAESHIRRTMKGI